MLALVWRQRHWRDVHRVCLIRLGRLRIGIERRQRVGLFCPGHFGQFIDDRAQFLVRATGFATRRHYDHQERQTKSEPTQERHLSHG